MHRSIGAYNRSIAPERSNLCLGARVQVNAGELCSFFDRKSGLALIADGVLHNVERGIVLQSDTLGAAQPFCDGSDVPVAKADARNLAGMEEANVGILAVARSYNPHRVDEPRDYQMPRTARIKPHEGSDRRRLLSVP